MSYYGWKPYVPVAKRREKAEKAVAKAPKSGAATSPVAAFRGALAKTFWGKAWCDNLERYSDYSNRLPRGRTYVRNGSVIDLKIGGGSVHAQVMGSSLYRVEVMIKDIPDPHWEKIATDCSGSIATLVELLQGKLSKAVMERISRSGDGLFPAPKEIEFQCSCPDWASMCKHVAAVLYGVGNRLDQQPDILFTLRGVDATDLIADAGSGIDSSLPTADASKVLDDDSLADIFGIELASAPAPVKSKTAKPKTPAKKPSAKPVTSSKRASSSSKKSASSAPAPTVKKTKKATTASKTAAGKIKPTVTKTKSTRTKPQRESR